MDTAHWRAAHEAPTRPLRDAPSFTQGQSNGGYAFRFGLFQVTADDMALIARAMGADAFQSAP